MNSDEIDQIASPMSSTGDHIPTHNPSSRKFSAQRLSSRKSSYRHRGNIEEDEQEIKPVLFGDHFGSRASYFNGISYAGRKKFLHTDKKENPLLPPIELRTKSQMRTVLKLRSQGVQQMQKLDFAKKNETVEEIANKAAKNHAVQARKNRKKSIIVVEKYSSTRKQDWTEDSLAGCKFWVNRNSGEVSTECPWVDHEDGDSVRDSLCGSVSGDDLSSEGRTEAEDAPWYDSSAVENFLDMLDSSKVKPTKAPATSSSPTKRDSFSPVKRDSFSPVKRPSINLGGNKESVSTVKRVSINAAKRGSFIQAQREAVSPVRRESLNQAKASR